MTNAKELRRKAVEVNGREEKERQEKIKKYLDYELDKILTDRANEGIFDYYLPYENIPEFTDVSEIEIHLQVASYKTELREKSLKIDWSEAK